jgi:predicted transposase/invertase (TIGR01784 family)
MQFLRSKRKEEFEMIAAKNPEIRKAVNTLYELSADERTRAEYEMHMRAVRDRAWLKDEGLQQGRQEGAQELLALIKSGKTPDEAMAILFAARV